MGQSYVLRARTCRVCGAEIPGVVTDTKPVSPTSMKECLRRCACGKGGFSNGKSPTWIWADPSENVPLEVRTGLREAVADSINEGHRRTKLFRFGFETSEDAVTWTVFRYLQQSARVRERLVAAGNIVAARAQAEPTMLLWGSPFPAADAKGRQIKSTLLEILNALGEHSRSYAEPDVLLDFAEGGVVAIKATYRERNEQKGDSYTGWKSYVSSDAFRDAPAAKRTGFYELVRNWRIVWELSSGRPSSLINIGTARLASDKPALDQFHAALTTGPDRQFRVMTWMQLLGDVSQLPPWLRTWVESRDLISS